MWDRKMLIENRRVESDFFIDFYHKVNSARTSAELSNHLEAVFVSFDFAKYAVLYVPEVAEHRFRPRVVASNWPKGFLDRYDKLRLLEKSPVFAKLNTQTKPTTIDLDTMEMGPEKLEQISKEQKLLFDLLRQHGGPRSVYFPCTDSRGMKGAISISSERQLPSCEETSILHLVCHYAFSHLHFLKSTRGSKTDLTKREEDCLTWAARGKTNYECSTILGISENTVAGYLASTSRKLSARNKAHMIALAYENGLLNRQGHAQSP